MIANHNAGLRLFDAMKRFHVAFDVVPNVKDGSCEVVKHSTGVVICIAALVRDVAVDGKKEAKEGRDADAQDGDNQFEPKHAMRRHQEWYNECNNDE